jgi:uncharacterized protein YfiM (DUF2279 family)
MLSAVRSVGIYAGDQDRVGWGWWAVFRDPDGNTYGLGRRGG